MRAHTSEVRATKKQMTALLCSLMLSACMTAPDYRRPELGVPGAFRSEIPVSEAGSFADLPWWTVFNDPALQALIREALGNNNDLDVAIARIEQARARVGIARSEALPQVGYEGLVAGDKVVIPERDNLGSLSFGTVQALLNATWELDLWGRIRHATAAARADLLAQEHVRRGVILILVSDVAAGYFRLLELDRELAIAQESARVYKNTLDLFTARFDAGRDSRLPVERAQANYDSSTADIQDITREITQQENAISTLLGAFPKPIPRGRTLMEQSIPATPPGSTTALLQRRPDILEAEQNMVEANEEIGVAVADFFPRIGLSTFLGGEGVGLEDASGLFGVWNLALSAAGPIYTGGRLQEQYYERQAFWDETVAQYKQKVLVAFQETSDALAAQQTLALRRTALQSQVRALQNSSELALMRYDAGRASYFEVLEAQQQLFPVEDELAQTELDQLIAVINLYKALGGGWQGTEADVPPGATIPARTETPSGAGETP